MHLDDFATFRAWEESSYKLISYLDFSMSKFHDMCINCDFRKLYSIK